MSIKRLSLCWVGLLMAGLLLLVVVAPLHAAVYHVSQFTGSDTNSGDQTHPFATIQAAAQVAEAGDTVIIQAGTYRETVIPAHSGTSNSPIVFTSDGGRVILDGADIITGWYKVPGQNYYQAEQVSGFHTRINQASQVFCDGQALLEARWPVSKSPDPLYPTEATIQQVLSDDGKGNVTISDPALTQPKDFWVGAHIHYSPFLRWFDYTGNVTASSPGQLSFRTLHFGSPDGSDHVAAGSCYFLFNTPQAPSAPNVWYWDRASQSLYVCLPNDDTPTVHTIEFKRRDYAFDLSGKSYITLRGLTLRGCTVTTDDDAGDGLNGARFRPIASANHIILDHLDVRYPSHFTDLNGSFYLQWVNITGIILSGSDNTLENSTISESDGNGVSCLGQRNLVLNNTIHDVDLAMGNGAGINLGHAGSSETRITHNTIDGGAGSMILFSGSHTHIDHNLIRNGGTLDKDCGAIYTFSTHGDGAEIDHNIISQNEWNIRIGTHYYMGIYLDGGGGVHRIFYPSDGYIVHHNLIIKTGIQCGPVKNEVYNNTAGFMHPIAIKDDPTRMDGPDCANNIFYYNKPDNFRQAKVGNIGHNIVWQDNLRWGTDPKFVGK